MAGAPGRRPARLVALPLVLLLAACSSGGGSGAGGAPASSGSAGPGSGGPAASGPAASGGVEAAPTGPLAFTEPGPYPVGTVEVEATNGPITVWYPGDPAQAGGQPQATYDMRSFLPEADQAKLASESRGVVPMDAVTDLPAAQPTEPFPLVLFSHGFCGYRQQSSFLTTAIASWGFVVAAPEHSARDLTACLAGTIGQGASTDVEDLRGGHPRPRGGEPPRRRPVGHHRRHRSGGGRGALGRRRRRGPDERGPRHRDLRRPGRRWRRRPVAQAVAVRRGRGRRDRARRHHRAVVDVDGPIAQAAGRAGRGHPPRLHGPLHDRRRRRRHLQGRRRRRGRRARGHHPAGTPTAAIPRTPPPPPPGRPSATSPSPSCAPRSGSTPRRWRWTRPSPMPTTA